MSARRGARANGTGTGAGPPRGPSAPGERRRHAAKRVLALLRRVVPAGQRARVVGSVHEEQQVRRRALAPMHGEHACTQPRPLAKRYTAYLCHACAKCALLLGHHAE